MFDHDLLRSFVAIADSGSFTAASELVGRTTSAVSMQVKRLEEQVGAALFERSAQGVRLTARGEVLLIHARRILAAHRTALDALVQAGSGETVAIGMPQEYVASLVPQLVARMAAAASPATLRILCEPSHELAKRLDEAAIDLAVLTELQIGDERGDILRDERACWVCAAGLDVGPLDPLPLAVDTEGCAFRRAAIEQLTAIGRAHRLAVVGAHPVLRAAVLSGRVVGLIPECTLAPGMRELRPEDGFPALPPVVLRLRRARRPRSPLAETVAGHLLAR